MRKIIYLPIILLFLLFAACSSKVATISEEDVEELRVDYNKGKIETVEDLIAIYKDPTQSPETRIASLQALAQTRHPDAIKIIHDFMTQGVGLNYGLLSATANALIEDQTPENIAAMVNGIVATQRKYIEFRTAMMQKLESHRKELAEVRKQMRELEIRVSIPEIRKEINKLIQLPEMTHEIMLKNGTIVKGKIIHEDLDRIIIQTQIGQLTLSKKNIKLTRKADLPKANCVVEGAITDEVYENKRVFKGKIKNNGIRRADSTFISGNYHMYKSGVQTDATIEPGRTFTFECSVDLPEEALVSYYIKEIKWEEFE
ncbi:MAG: hypothetical protein L6422_00045 [Candidatus Marinimicrobia bacterium]|nr:hypothetical protein [bacterium]MCG2714668.1 hypothetical protein [Candidatus Neomarinimicrobiota bacterium]